MGDFMIDWSEIGLDGSINGIPIPRSQHAQPYSRIDLSSNYYQAYEHDSPSHRPPLVPPNSLVNSGSQHISSQFGYSIDHQRLALSPSDSPLMPNSNMDMDMEIKMEPLEDLLDISGMINSNTNESNHHEDNLLDNVNFDDLLMTDDMESSTTCLDPQHSSPAAMATVHPDEVLGMTRNEANINHYNQSFTFTSSSSIPVKTETYSFGLGGSSFPPLGHGWKDPFMNISVPNQALGHYTNQLEVVKEGSPHSTRISPVGLNRNMSEQVDQQTFNNNEVIFSQGESNSNSALRELLVNSPSTSHSNHATNACSLSPFRNIAEQEQSIGKSVPGPPSFLTNSHSLFSSRLSSSAPVNDFNMEKIWQRREPRQHLISTGSLVGLEEAGGSTSSLSTGGGILSPPPHELSIDEGIDSEDDSDVEHYDSDSDNDSIMSEEMSSIGHSTKKERHFWQYNVQAKGPKGQRVNIIQKETDPHQLCKIMDPVFSPMCSIQGIKHSGKARRGDGNDLTPSPQKLVSIGLELEKLNKKINEMTPVSELPSTIRSKSRKEKNKLASRACRLKKKAQHEANKIKLYGLEQEHKALLTLIVKVREDIVKKVDFGQRLIDSDSSHQIISFRSQSNEAIPHLQQHLTIQIEKAAKGRTKQRIAGHTTEFVNKVIENSRNGNSSGGLNELAQTFVKSNTPTGESNPDHGLYT